MIMYTIINEMKPYLLSFTVSDEKKYEEALEEGEAVPLQEYKYDDEYTEYQDQYQDQYHDQEYTDQYQEEYNPQDYPEEYPVEEEIQGEEYIEDGGRQYTHQVETHGHYKDADPEVRGRYVDHRPVEDDVRRGRNPEPSPRHRYSTDNPDMVHYPADVEVEVRGRYNPPEQQTIHSQYPKYPTHPGPAEKRPQSTVPTHAKRQLQHMHSVPRPPRPRSPPQQVLSPHDPYKHFSEPTPVPYVDMYSTHPLPHQRRQQAIAGGSGDPTFRHPPVGQPRSYSGDYGGDYVRPVFPTAEGAYHDHPHYHVFEDEVCYKCEEGKTGRIRHPAGDTVPRRQIGNK